MHEYIIQKKCDETAFFNEINDHKLINVNFLGVIFTI